MLIVCATSAPDTPCRQAVSGAEVVVCGVGKIAAASETALALARHRYGLVVSAGVAGALPRSDLAVGDVVVATKVRVVDEGLRTGSGFVPFDRPGMPVPGARWAVPDPEWRSRVLSVQVQGFRLRSGPVATVSECAGTDELAHERASQGFVAEAMEGAAVAHAAEHHRVPFLELRAISNPCGNRDGTPFELERPMANLAIVLAAALSPDSAAASEGASGCA